MIDRILRILAINPGSTSTKIAVFDNEECRLRRQSAIHRMNCMPAAVLSDKRICAPDISHGL